MVYYWKKIKYYFPYFRGGGQRKYGNFHTFFFFEPFPYIQFRIRESWQISTNPRIKVARGNSWMSCVMIPLSVLRAAAVSFYIYNVCCYLLRRPALPDSWLFISHSVLITSDQPRPAGGTLLGYHTVTTRPEILYSVVKNLATAISSTHARRESSTQVCFVSTIFSK